jgi:pectin methylesterase-like acyl-CoA thioesterase
MYVSRYILRPSPERKSWMAVISLLVLVSNCGPLGAKALHVPQDYKTIQAAVDAAVSGDMVLVAPGTYRERIRLTAGVTLKSAGNDAPGKLGLQRAETTIIEGNVADASGAGVTMAEDSTLDGFTVTGIGQ